MTADGDGPANAGSDGSGIDGSGCSGNVGSDGSGNAGVNDPASVVSAGAASAGDEPANASGEPERSGADGSGSAGAARTELSLAYASEPLSLEAFDVKLRETRQLLGVECEFYVIGSSHYVAAPALDAYELLSCRDLGDRRTTTVPLADADGAHEVSFASDAVVVDTRIEARPLSAYPDPSTCDIAYRFGPDAYTTIDCRTDGYETYHTYPEHELALYTTSTFERVDDGVATRETEADHRSEATGGAGADRRTGADRATGTDRATEADHGRSIDCD